MKKKTPVVSGTKEWSSKSVNCLLGCSHRCRYCYARYDAKKRKFIAKWDEWGDSYYRIRPKEVKKSRPKYEGTVMFPTTHDIPPEFLDECLTVLKKLLEAKNKVLVVSKPQITCLKRICDELEKYKKQILFRFSIGAMDDEILSYWEPGAPSFNERLLALCYAFENGFATSISAEPMLDSDHITELFYRLEPLVTDSIWIGKMNHMDSRIEPRTKKSEIKRIEAGQTDERIHKIYEALKNEPKVRWKESFKKVLGLELAQKAGLDK
jgi:DNA repair photolyase